MLVALLLASALPLGCAQVPGTRTLNVTAARLPREVLVVVGEEVRGPAPVLFAWHGFGGSPQNLLRALSVDTLWRGAIVVLPKGLGRTFAQFGDVEKPGFQVLSNELGGRDLALFDVVLERLLKDGCADGKRIYSTGFSNGGFISNMLACVRADRLAAIAPVGGGGPFEPCAPGVPVRLSHAVDDTVVPWHLAQESAETFATLNRCPSSPAPRPGTCAVVACDGITIMFCAARGGHTWGGPSQAQDIASFLLSQRRK